MVFVFEMQLWMVLVFEFQSELVWVLDKDMYRYKPRKKLEV